MMAATSANLQKFPSKFLLALMIAASISEAAFKFGIKHLSMEATTTTFPAKNRIFCAAQCEVRKLSCQHFMYEDGVCQVLFYQEPSNLTLTGLPDGPAFQYPAFSRPGSGVLSY